MADPKVLIIEDDEELHTLYSLFLQGKSFEIVQAFNGVQAIQALEKELPDAIILDMIMPEMDGETFLREIHKKNLAQDVAVIIASVNDKIPEDLLEMPNVHKVLRKPVSIDTLVGSLTEVIKS